ARSASRILSGSGISGGFLNPTFEAFSTRFAKRSKKWGCAKSMTLKTPCRGHAHDVSPALLLLSCFCLVPAFAQTPLLRAHAHNDYEHTRPLLDALEQGFCSVEADIYLIDGELRVAHDL